MDHMYSSYFTISLLVLSHDRNPKHLMAIQWPSWENSLFPRPFSIANCKRLPEGKSWSQSWQAIHGHPNHPSWPRLYLRLLSQFLLVLLRIVCRLRLRLVASLAALCLRLGRRLGPWHGGFEGDGSSVPTRNLDEDVCLHVFTIHTCSKYTSSTSCNCWSYDHQSEWSCYAN